MKSVPMIILWPIYTSQWIDEIDPPPNPAPPENACASDHVQINVGKQSKSAHNQSYPAKQSRTTSPAPKSSEDIGINGKTYCQVHLHTYSVSASKSSSTQSLVDHGANGRIGGSDVCFMHKTHPMLMSKALTTMRW